MRAYATATPPVVFGKRLSLSLPTGIKDGNSQQRSIVCTLGCRSASQETRLSNLPDGIWEEIKAADEQADQQAKQQLAAKVVAERRSSLRRNKRPTAKAVENQIAKKVITKKRAAQIQCKRCGKLGQVGKACECPERKKSANGRAKKPPPGSPWEVHQHKGQMYYWNRGEHLRQQPRTHKYMRLCTSYNPIRTQQVMSRADFELENARFHPFVVVMDGF